MPRFQSKAQELHAHLSDFAQQQFGEWVELVESELRDDASGLAMQLTGRLLEVSKDDHSLVVNYSDRLVGFLREVRPSSALPLTSTLALTLTLTLTLTPTPTLTLTLTLILTLPLTRRA